MSHLLDQAAKVDPQRRADLERNDDVLRAAVDGRACRAGGNHKSAQNDEPEPQHTDAWHKRNDAQALAIQQQWLDAMRRAGW